MMNMMNDMSAILEGKTGYEFDRIFIEDMIPHYEGAIDIARAALKSKKHEEMKTLARDIISTQ